MADKKFKQLIFNELTLKPLCSDEAEVYKRVTQYARTFQSAQNELGTKLVRCADDLSSIKLSEDTNLIEFCAKYKREAGMIAILSSHVRPMVDPDDEEKTDSYIETSVSLSCDTDHEEVEGLTAAYVYNVPTIGMASSDFWSEVMHDVRVVSGGKELKVLWPCLTAPEHLQSDQFKMWVQEHSEIELLSTNLTYEEKVDDIEVNLRDDHGKDVLIEHAKRLLHSEYVVGILCSRPFAPNHRKYVKTILPDGLIDIVLFWDDRGLSMRVKTTGRNFQETAAIAALLQEKYSR